MRTAVLSCDSGNGRVVGGQTSCVTGLLRPKNASSRFIASAHYYVRVDPGWPWHDNAWGQTTGVRA